MKADLRQTLDQFVEEIYADAEAEEACREYSNEFANACALMLENGDWDSAIQAAFWAEAWSVMAEREALLTDERQLIARLGFHHARGQQSLRIPNRLQAALREDSI